MTAVAAAISGRIIPARAGFTHPPRRPRGSREDHPRSRGVYCLNPVMRSRCAGSSPLARGLPALGPLQRRFGRIIPARAGFTITVLIGVFPCKDHPRSRGVYSPGCDARHIDFGSSPLARGLRSPWSAQQRLVGIIPARAGFTRAAAPYALRHQDHPRSRGVYTAEKDIPGSGQGSSPLARGLLRLNSDDAPWAGIIPARAGFTLCATLAAYRARDHPRSRGVYGRTGDHYPRARGSSPLARGLPPVHRSARDHPGCVS